VQESSPDNLASLLRRLRRSQMMTQDQLAAKAQVARSTLVRWERGNHQPRIPELIAVLDVLNASPEERTEALTLISASRAIQSLRAEQHQPIEAGQDWMFSPETGDLLRVMRIRRGMTQEQVADSIGIRRVSLSRWETGDLIPSAERLNDLMVLLGALPAEKVALTRGVLAPSYLAASADDPFEAAVNHYEQVTKGGFDPVLEPLKDLEYLRLERTFANLSISHPAARQYLLNTYSHHAHWLSVQSRFHEAGKYADRVLEAVEAELPREPEWMRVIPISARAAAYGGGLRRVKRGASILESWLPSVQPPEFHAWILGDLSFYLAEEGNLQSAIEVASKSCRVAVRCENPYEISNRRTDLAEILLKTEQSGDAARATDLLPPILANHPQGRVREALLWAKALWLTEDRVEACKWLDRASQDSLAFNLDPGPVQELSQRF